MIRGQIAADPINGLTTADQIRKLSRLKRFLCTMAWPVRNVKYGADGTIHNGQPKVQACKNCPSQCAYGRKFIELSGG